MIVPSDEISRLSSTVKALFLRWTDFMYSRVRFNMPDSELHATAHCERVLLFGLLIGEKQFPDNSTAWEILAHASVFLTSILTQDTDHVPPITIGISAATLLIYAIIRKLNI